MKATAVSLVSAVVVAGSAIGGTAFIRAVDRPSTGTVKACVGKKHAVVGAMKSGKCPKGSQRISINQVGPGGPPGASGAPGPVGSPGVAGPPGPTATVTTVISGDPQDIDGGTP